eukprot:gene8447-17416_t
MQLFFFTVVLASAMLSISAAQNAFTKACYNAANSSFATECGNVQYTYQTPNNPSHCLLISSVEPNGGPNQCPQNTLYYSYFCGSETPTLQPTVAVTPCAFSPVLDINTNGNCREGNVIQTFGPSNSITLGTCQTSCSQSVTKCVSLELTDNGNGTYTCVTKSATSGTLTTCPMPNTKTYDDTCNNPCTYTPVVNLNTNSQCREGNVIQTIGPSNSITLGTCQTSCTYSTTKCASLELTDNNDGTYTCVLKSATSGSPKSCPLSNTKTYDNDCISPAPTMAPVVTTCPWYKTPNSCREGNTISSSTGKTVDQCRAACLAAKNPACNSIEYTSVSLSCELKSGRNDVIKSCPYTDIYDYNCPTHVPTSAPTIRSKDCASLMLADSFGDYSNAQLFVYDNHNHMWTYSTTCEENPIYTEYCFDSVENEDGDYAIILVHGYTIQYAYDLKYQVYIAKDGSLYTGNYLTLMKFVYRKYMVNGMMTTKIELCEESEEIQPNEEECNSCLVSKPNSPLTCEKKEKPKPKPKPAPPAPKPVNEYPYHYGNDRNADKYPYQYSSVTQSSSPSAAPKSKKYTRKMASYGSQYSSSSEIGSMGSVQNSASKSSNEHSVSKTSNVGAMGTVEHTDSKSSVEHTNNVEHTDSKSSVEHTNNVEHTDSKSSVEHTNNVEHTYSKSSVEHTNNVEHIDSKSSVEHTNNVEHTDSKSSVEHTNNVEHTDSKSSVEHTNNVEHIDSSKAVVDNSENTHASIHSDSTSTEESTDSTSGSESSEVSHEEYLEVTATNNTTGSVDDMTSDAASPWYMKNGLGAKYTVTNLNGDVVYYMGTMCGNGDDSVCEMCLAPGCYMYRVDGAFDEQADKVKWNFCDKEGGVSSQLYFCIGEDYK